MALTPDTLSDLTETGFDTVIDVRSPAEFAEDHLPRAINLPVLSNDERAQVGTIYKQDSPFRARKIGAALVARNAAAHLEGPLADKPGGWRPLVYCWRGGQRSGSFAAILTQVGWRAETVTGGYRAWRRMVVRALYDDPWPGRLVLLDGNTGTAKTEILARLASRGVQVIDLEALACHRGSLFGGVATPQPSQKAFESAIACALAGFDPARPVVVEAESSKVGDLLVPPSLWSAMRAAPRLVIAAPRAARARYLTRAYGDLGEDPGRVSDTLARLAPYHGHVQIEAWQAMAANGEAEALADSLMAVHYDPRYGRARGGVAVAAKFRAERLDEGDIDKVAGQVEAWISAID
ncbi:MAG: tRNA 2-selenouridine(34) synthase MnmH [Pseudomonadota bacterium]